MTASPRVLWGVDAQAHRRGEQRVVSWEPARLANGHLLLVGMSGAGKTHQLRRLIDQIGHAAGAPAALRFRIFDVHDDIEVPGSSDVLFSEQTDYGLNPFRVDPDPHYGGPRKCIQGFVSALTRASRALGPRQEGALRTLLAGLFEAHGFRQDDPATWRLSPAPSASQAGPHGQPRLYLEVPFEDNTEARRAGAQFDDGRSGAAKGWWCEPPAYTGALTRWPLRVAGRRHPTLTDLIAHARRVLKQQFMGSNVQAIQKLEAYARAVAGFNAKRLRMHKRGESFNEGEARDELARLGSRTCEVFEEFVSAAVSGRELETLLAFDSIETLRSVIDRLENLAASGLFRPQPPPFDPQARIWRYRLKPLAVAERRLFVSLALREMFEQAKQRGPCEQPLDYLIVDEAANYCDDDPDNELSLISREGRKFGLALICAAQSPAHFHDDFLSSVATKMLLAIDETYWDVTARKLKLPAEGLRWLVARQNALIQTKLTGEPASWQYTLLPQDGAQRRAA
jgi:hypothetical protein